MARHDRVLLGRLAVGLVAVSATPIRYFLARDGRDRFRLSMDAVVA